MRRVLLVLSLMAVMAMLLAAMAVPAFAKNVKLEEHGEPIFSGSENGGALHCGPFYDEASNTETNYHGALPSNGKGGYCVQAPQE